MLIVTVIFNDWLHYQFHSRMTSVSFLCSKCRLRNVDLFLYFILILKAKILLNCGFENANFCSGRLSFMTQFVLVLQSQPPTLDVLRVAKKGADWSI